MSFMRLKPGLALLAGVLLAGCSVLPQMAPPGDGELAPALEIYTKAKKAHAREPTAANERKLDVAAKSYEDKTLSAARKLRDEGNWFEARSVLDHTLETMPDSKRLLDARSEIEQERTARLARNDCRMAAARARYLADKSALLKTRAPLEAKDYLKDWLTRRERSELKQLGADLKLCGQRALADKRLDLAEESIRAAEGARGEHFVADERRQLDQIRRPPQPPKPATPREPVETPQQKIRALRVTLQSAMTRGDLKQARTVLVDLRRLEGDTPQLKDLSQSVDAAIAAYINEVNERASAHYRERQIEQARDLWQEILELDPDNTQARTNLDRAERVLKKLEELQGASPEPAPPTTSPGSMAPSPVTTPTPLR